MDQEIHPSGQRHGHLAFCIYRGFNAPSQTNVTEGRKGHKLPMALLDVLINLGLCDCGPSGYLNLVHVRLITGWGPSLAFVSLEAPSLKSVTNGRDTPPL